MNLDIRTAVQTAFFLTVIGVLLSGFLGIQSIRAGKRLLFFRKRRDLMMRGWRLIFIAFVLAPVAFVLNRYAEPTVYRFFPPSPTVTLTPTITLTSTITLTPTITDTPTITFTPAISPTPEFPQNLLIQITSIVTPNPASVFSTMQFSKSIKVDKNTNQPLPVDPATEFGNPVGALYATFSYDKMSPNSQWSMLWYRLSDHTLICSALKPWDGSTGGYGYSECSPSADQWLPGDYEVQIFVGTSWNQSSRFTVTGTAPTTTITPTPSRTITSTFTSTSTKTPPGPTLTFTVTLTRTPSLTPTITLTRTPSLTPTPSKTPPPTSTMRPSLTPAPTETHWPSLTPRP
jgi:hypothetical protein